MNGGPADAIGRTLADLANAVGERALASDPALLGRLQAIAGKCIEIQCTAPPMQWNLVVAEKGLQVAAGASDAPDAVIKGNALQLTGWLLPGTPMHVEVDGDVLLLTELRDMLSTFSPDLSEPLSRMVGEDSAATLLGTAELGLKSLQSALSGLRDNLSSSAWDMFVQQREFDSLLGGIDALRLRVDRLAARVNHIEAGSEPPPK